MIDGFVNIKQENFGLFSLFGDEPFIGQIDKPATIDEHEQFYSLVFSRIFDSFLQLCIRRDWIDLILYALTLEELLKFVKKGLTVRIFKLHKESISTAV